MSARKPLYYEEAETNAGEATSYSAERGDVLKGYLDSEEEEAAASLSEDSEYDDELLQKQSSKKESPPPNKQRLPLLSQNVQIYLLTVILTVSMAVGLYKICNFNSSKDDIKTCNFNNLRERPPLQSDKVWKALQVGIENMLNKRQITPNVYLFIYEDQSLKKLTKEIALESSRCFGHQKFIEMSRDDFINGHSGDDYGHAIEQYKKKIENGKVLVIINLNELPALVARALHTICDTINPIAEEVVIYLTLHPLKPTDPNTKPIQLAYDTLYELWGKHLKSNELDPLITRVTDQILHLQS